MEKKYLLSSCLIYFLFLNVSAQSAFDEKLKSLYKNTVPIITVTELKNALLKKEKLILLDTRAWEEYQVSHLPKANFIDYKKFSPHDVDTLDLRTPVVVYCSVGYRSERIGEKLIALGFRDVKNLYGGIFEWVNRGNPVVNVAGKPTENVHTYNRNWSQWLLNGVKVY